MFFIRRIRERGEDTKIRGKENRKGRVCYVRILVIHPSCSALRHRLPHCCPVSFHSLRVIPFLPRVHFFTGSCLIILSSSRSSVRDVCTPNHTLFSWFSPIPPEGTSPSRWSVHLNLGFVLLHPQRCDPTGMYLTVSTSSLPFMDVSLYRIRPFSLKDVLLFPQYVPFPSHHSVMSSSHCPQSDWNLQSWTHSSDRFTASDCRTQFRICSTPVGSSPSGYTPQYSDTSYSFFRYTPPSSRTPQSWMHPTPLTGMQLPLLVRLCPFSLWFIPPHDMYNSSPDRTLRFRVRPTFLVGGFLCLLFHKLRFTSQSQ